MDKPTTILVADDCVTHTQSLEQAFATVGLDVRINVIRDGQKAIDYLSRDPITDIFGEFPVPDLLLLDLDMPKMDGFGVLNWVRTKSKCRQLPIIVLSAASELEYVRRAYSSGAHGYLVKPFSWRDYTSLVEYVKRFLHDIGLSG